MGHRGRRGAELLLLFQVMEQLDSTLANSLELDPARRVSSAGEDHDSQIIRRPEESSPGGFHCRYQRTGHSRHLYGP